MVFPVGSSDPFSVSRFSESARMEVNRLYCTLNMPKAIESVGDEVHSLPPYNPRPAFWVDEYPGCPEHWMRSSMDLSSYFVPVKDGYGMWLDFNANNSHTHHVAIVISVQGINAITGQKMEGVRLEQYKRKCPVHSTDFGPERFCQQCGYKWPEQNYLATTATRDGLLWLDGFRLKGGEVRQYVFTRDTTRGVAAQIIGEERVYALGIAFFLSKDPKPRPVPDYSRMYLGHSKGITTRGDVYRGIETLGRIAAPEIAAGARIRQDVSADASSLDFWQDKCAGQIVVNYLFEEEAMQIIQAGREKQGDDNGFMRGLKVGNPFKISI